jgi:cysteine desulfurase family protein
VYATLRAHLEQEGACPGRGTYAMARRSGAVVEHTRALLARLFRAPDPSRIIFALNASDALNIAIKGALGAGDHAVSTLMEHNSVTRPLNRLQQEGRVRLTWLSGSPDGLIDPSDVRQALESGTRLVALAHGSNATGALQPIREIGAIVREHGAWLLVDAAQTAGCVPIDVQADNIDLLAFPGHKALLGPPGTGGLYVGPRVKLSPWREGGTGVWSEDPLQPETLPYALEAGSPNTLGIAALGESLRWLQKKDPARIREHERALIDRIIRPLSDDGRFILHGPRDWSQRIAVLAVTVCARAPADVAAFLDSAFGIAVRAGLHCAPGAHRLMGTFPQGTVRISPGCFSTLADIDRCVTALRQAADTLAESAATAGCFGKKEDGF